jgi:hypothetical protein
MIWLCAYLGMTALSFALMLNQTDKVTREMRTDFMAAGVPPTLHRLLTLIYFFMGAFAWPYYLPRGIVLAIRRRLDYARKAKLALEIAARKKMV